LCRYDRRLADRRQRRRATAAAIPGAELVVLDGMGHDLPRKLWTELSDRIGGLVERVERRRMLG
jgi:hypothetical protein